MEDTLKISSRKQSKKWYEWKIKSKYKNEKSYVMDTILKEYSNSR